MLLANGQKGKSAVSTRCWRRPSLAHSCRPRCLLKCRLLED